MPSRLLIKNARIINEGEILPGHVLIRGAYIEDVLSASDPVPDDVETLDAEGNYLLPGLIDDQVHFREPGLTYKACLESESRAAVAGGITSFMDMPNTVPQTTTLELLEQKYLLASERSIANYAFFLGATNNNLGQLLAADPATVCGIKVFMGASTGDMLVDDEDVLTQIFSKVRLLVAVHSESESVIRENIRRFTELYGNDILPAMHPLIRSHEACMKSTERALAMARKYHTRLHLLHLSTEAETRLLDPQPLSDNKRITAEACVHHLWFSDADYARLGNLIKWNPAIKTEADRQGLLQALADGRIDIVATDHAPHALEEKQQTYLQCPSGGPMVQHALPLMFEIVRRGELTPAQVVELMCHKVAQCFGIQKRGYIRKGYYADLAIVNPDMPWTVEKSNILYKCGWSPLEGQLLHARVTHTFVNGRLVYNHGVFDGSVRGQALAFDR